MANFKIVFDQVEPISYFEVLYPEDVEKQESTEEASAPEVSEAAKHLDDAMERMLQRFVNACDAHLFIAPFVTNGLAGLLASTINIQLKKVLEEHAQQVEAEGSRIVYEMPIEDTGHLWNILDRIKSIKHASDSYTRSLIVQLSMLFDILMGSLVEQVAVLKPSVLEASERKIDFADVGKYSSIEELKRYFVEKQIDSVVRKSRSEQFRWLEDKLSIRLNKNLDGWAEFVEINERRNLFTHTAGHVTKEYITNCTDAGCKSENLSKLGDILEADPPYVERASELFFVIGIKLAQVIWRKLSEDFCGAHLSNPDLALLVTTFELNKSGKYKLASQLGNFACGDVIKRHGSEKAKRILYVNYAASLMLQGKTKDADNVLKKLDWDAVSPEFAISVAAVRGDIDGVCALMPKAVNAEAISKVDLQEWPVFYNMRKDKKFMDAYKELFKEDFVGRTATKKISVTQVGEVSQQIKNMSKYFSELKEKSKSQDPKLLH